MKYSSNFFSKFYTYLSAITGRQYTYSFLETNKLLNQIRKVKPDIVHVHILNCNTVNLYKVLAFLKENNYKVIITFHAEYLYTGGCAHALDCMKWIDGCKNCPRLWDATHSFFIDKTHYFWKRFETIYAGFENLKIVCVSDWLKERVIKSPFFVNTDISVIENGIDTTNVFFPQHNIELFNKFKSGGKKILLHVTPSFRLKNKGGEYVIKLAERLDKDLYHIIIIGYDGDVELPLNITAIKNINNQKLLAEYYSLADLTILTSQVETYSMVCVESLSCGTPVVGFKCGAPEMIALKKYSSFVEYGDLNELEWTIYSWADRKPAIGKQLREEAASHYSKEKMVNSYIDAFKNYI
jgi:putative colanic acid biosynthesis glycosyltransferase